MVAEAGPQDAVSDRTWISSFPHFPRSRVLDSGRALGNSFPLAPASIWV